MKKWICTLCGHIYDPEKENPPGEAAGASRCFFVDEGGERKFAFTCGRCGAPGESFKEHRD